MHLLDAQAARFGEFDDADDRRPDRGRVARAPRRNIFYSPGVLAALGWPSERDRRSASTAALSRSAPSPSRHVVVSTFTLDDEALVEPSPADRRAAARPDRWTPRSRKSARVRRRPVRARGARRRRTRVGRVPGRAQQRRACRPITAPRDLSRREPCRSAPSRPYLDVSVQVFRAVRACAWTKSARTRR